MPLRRVAWALSWALGLASSGCGAGAAEGAGVAAASGAAGDVGLPGEQHPAVGVTTGGVPSTEALNRARAMGYHTVVSLLVDDEPGLTGEEEAVTSRGMRFVRIPVAGSRGLDEASARRLGEVLHDPAAKPVLLHCSSGNRAGALLALEAFYVEGASVDDALELGRAAGLTRLEPSVRAQLEAAASSR
jgi:protein tyrosine phosphatase (PTP) superfamily phosphohydrolase (DUF442 family)